MNKYFRFMAIVAVAAVSISLASCATPGFGPAGILFSDTTVGVYAKSPGGDKIGEACNQTILGLVAWGDGSVATAALNGGVNDIHSINLKGFNVPFVYGKLCTVVRGN